MTKILHLAETGHWRHAQESGVYSRSTRGAGLADVGFIHCSSTEQLPVVAGFIYADYPGELYPHIYGALRCEWVAAIHPALMVNGALVVG